MYYIRVPILIHPAFQSQPSGMPELLQPTFTKLDLPKLQADVASKYIKAGVQQGKLHFWEEIGDHLKSIEAKATATLDPEQWVFSRLREQKLTRLSSSLSESAPIPHHCL